MSLEAELREIWKDVLGVPEVRAEDDFRELGGTPRHGKKLAERLEAKFKGMVYPQIVLMAPTFGEHVKLVDKYYVQPPEKLPDDKPDVAKWRAFLGQAYHGQPEFPLAPPNPSPIFVLSPIRGGSTLLRVILAGNPSLFSPPELDMLNYSSMGTRHKGLGFGWWDYLAIERALMELRGCDAETAQREVQRWVEDDLPMQEAYRRLQELAAPRTLVDKSTAYGIDYDVLLRAEKWFDKPRYIHLTRHPLGTIRSFLESRMWQAVNFFPNPRHTAEMCWLISHQHFMQFLSGIPAERQHRVAFENVVTKPHDELSRLCTFLGVTYDPSMAEPYQGNRMVDGIDGYHAGDPTFHKRNKLDAGAASGSRRLPGDGPLTDETIAMAQQFGYTDL